jgi:hypothetical protein
MDALRRAKNYLFPSAVGDVQTKRSVADRNIAIVLVILVLVLWFLDQSRYDFTAGLGKQFPLITFAVALCFITLLAYYVVDPNKADTQIPKIVQVMIFPLHVMAVGIAAGFFGLESFRKLLMDNQFAQYIVGTVLLLAVLTLFIPRKKKEYSWKENFSRAIGDVAAGGLASTAVIAFLGPLFGPMLAVPVFGAVAMLTDLILKFYL